MEADIRLYRDYMGIMEEKMETTTGLYRGYIRAIKRLYRMMENRMETATL